MDHRHEKFTLYAVRCRQTLAEAGVSLPPYASIAQCAVQAQAVGVELPTPPRTVDLGAGRHPGYTGPSQRTLLERAARRARRQS